MIIGLVGLKQSGKSTALEVIQSLGNVQELQLAKHLKDVCSRVFNIYRPDLDDQRYKELEFGTQPAPLTFEEKVDQTMAPLLKRWGYVRIDPRMHHAQEHIKIDMSHLAQILALFEIPQTTENLERVKKHVGVILKTPRYAAQYVGTDVLRDFDPDIHIKMAVKTMDPTKIGVVSDIRFHNELESFSKTPGFVSIFIRRAAVIPADLSSQHPSERDVLDVGAKCMYRAENDTTVDEFRMKIKSIVENRIQLLADDQAMVA